MTKLDKLRATVEAMTAAPWELWTSNSFRRVTGPNGRDGGVLSGTVQRHDGHPDLAATPIDLSGIVALRNAAPALLEVIRLAGEWATARDKFGFPQSSSSDDRFESAGDSLVGALAQLEELLP